MGFHITTYILSLNIVHFPHQLYMCNWNPTSSKMLRKKPNKKTRMQFKNKFKVMTKGNPCILLHVLGSKKKKIAVKSEKIVCPQFTFTCSFLPHTQSYTYFFSISYLPRATHTFSQSRTFCYFCLHTK